jgi:dienelactone hydrolase
MIVKNLASSFGGVGICVALSCLFAGQALAQTVAPPATIRVPTMEQLAQFPSMTGFRVSPDGKHMIAIESAGDTRNIVVWKLADLSAKPTVIGAKNMLISSASFLKNDMLVVNLSQPYDYRGDRLVKTFISKLLFTDLEGKNWIEPMASVEIARTSDAKVQAALANPAVLSRMPTDPDHIVLESDSRGDTRDVFRYNVRTGAATRLMRLGESDGSVWVNDAGVPWAKSRGGSDGKGAFIAIDFRSTKGEWEEHFRSYVKDRDVVDVIAPGGKPNIAIIKSNVGQEFSAIYEYDIAEKKTASKLFEHKFFDATGVRSLDNDDGTPGPDGSDGFVYAGLFGSDSHWERPEIDAVILGVAQALGIKQTNQKLMAVSGSSQAEVRASDGVSVRLMRRIPGEAPTYLFRVSGLTYPTEHYLLQKQNLRLLAKEYPAIDRAALGTARFVYYPARDGLNIPAYLTVPNEKLCGPGPYAAVVHPHGGPWGRDAMEFESSWVPLLVTQCRVVLQPQFRGSADWGRTLWLAGDREWGQKMQDDKDDGAKWLVSQKLADPGRMAMFGFSYGGYAAFAAAVRPNDLYKCAIAGAGVSDIKRITARSYTNPYFKDAQESTIRGLNPLEQADKIKIPIMVYHGDRDQTVPLTQSDLFVDRAKAAGKPVEYHVLKDYAHGPAWTRQTMTQQLTIISDYLKTGCGGGGL